MWGMGSVAFVFPWIPRAGRQALKARWSRQLLTTLGVRLLPSGRPAREGLLVANHISWLDIFAINAVAPAAFVSKDEVLSWPLIGWLSARAETIFLERGSRAAALRTKEHIAATLRQRCPVALFPEGTTSFGDHVLPFHGALLQSALDAGAQVSPVALRYVDRDGHPSLAAAYVGDTSLGQCLRAISMASGLAVRVSFLPPIDPVGGDRRHLAAHAHRAIAHALTATPSRPVPPGDDRATEIPGDLRDGQPSDSHPTDILNPAPADSASA